MLNSFNLSSLIPRFLVNNLFSYWVHCFREDKFKFETDQKAVTCQLGVRFAISKHKIIIGPIFLEADVNSNIYLDIIYQFFASLEDSLIHTWQDKKLFVLVKVRIRQKDLSFTWEYVFKLSFSFMSKIVKDKQYRLQ